MIIGDPKSLAIESQISEAYEHKSLRALGYFVLHIDGRRYGVFRPDATMMACSFDEVEKRISKGGRHTAPFMTAPSAADIADAFINAIYAETQWESFFGLTLNEFSRFFNTNFEDCLWAPDGDEAFDDGSFVLQFDVQDRVRIIAFKFGADFIHKPETLRDLWMSTETFYEILQKWHQAFEYEWTMRNKIAVASEAVQTFRT